MKNKHHNGPGPSQRQLRVGEELRHVMSDVLRRGHFHSEILLNESHNVTVTEVRPSPDLKHARAYVMALGGVHLGKLLEALNEEHHTFQKEINRVTNLKFTPRVKFVEDESFEEAQRIESILNNLPHAAEDEEHGAA
ncbi:MAG: 30S ribosome-binding factor RbfA [Rhodospirillales bacterium]|nr:30S ribosome-binding factor RbfA [Rhodospirillales bacterium]